MATLTIRDFPDELRDRLRVQASQHGRSMEAEARRLLILGLSAEPRADRTHEKVVREVQAWVASRIAVPKATLAASDELIRDRRREVILEVIADGHEPAAVFGTEFNRICREADWTEDHVRLLAEPRP